VQEVVTAMAATQQDGFTRVQPATVFVTVSVCNGPAAVDREVQARSCFAR